MKAVSVHQGQTLLRLGREEKGGGGLRVVFSAVSSIVLIFFEVCPVIFLLAAANGGRGRYNDPSPSIGRRCKVLASSSFKNWYESIS